MGRQGDNNPDEVEGLKRQLRLLEEALGQSNRVRGQWHEASRKLATSQQALKESEALYHQVSDSSFDAIIIANQDGLIREANQAATRIFGYPVKAWKGLAIKVLIPEHLRTLHEKGFCEHIETGKHHIAGTIVKTEALHQDGHIFPIELIIAPLSQGETRTMATIRDITEQQNIEAQFRQAQKMEAVGTMVGGLAHEFNNMLAGMTGNLYLVKRCFDLEPALLDKLGKVEKLAFNAAEMIKQLLAFSRKGAISLQNISIVPLIKEVFKLQRISVSENIDLQLCVCQGEVYVRVDSTLLQQMLVNLINNAKDAVDGIDAPSIKVEVNRFTSDMTFAKKHETSNGKHYVLLSVSDNGCGITEEHIDHIFEPFYTNKPVGKGTGLGLSMTYGVVQSHDGVIEVDSEPDQGTAFHVYLPLTENDTLDS